MVLSPTVTELIQGHSLSQDTGHELLFCQSPITEHYNIDHFCGHHVGKTSETYLHNL